MTASTTSTWLGNPFRTARLLHTMIRVTDLGASLRFYVDMLQMKIQRQQDFPEGRFTLAFLGYADEKSSTVVELTYNWDDQRYDMGTAFGHIAVGVPDVAVATQWLADQGVTIVRPPGPLKGDSREVIAFVFDPDGYRVELVQQGDAPRRR
ncbi:lactoylglutathione lyase [Hydrogenophaga sp.]|uniref:lactoylglutathione lyase n=1 Tax=Hydrogenophaga sp. TaxID=1904254 RepID=UPI0027369FD7|nr:lactoylglutathione lyase [Hydrogenophaga sp.]MDP3347781.1 lactoylglutathione lyase [Hydrogenophaga sp.]MDZ4398702.1 lactoylglutathione lyase [Hydrogenophaga sp.]